ncbi:MAG: hydroxymyristoyl-ACP dehydratase [Geobacteraceae bacterium GWC2_58_44]|nr:MAG: hydroxymyristoyl-ACP dehydratase [Geobacteraceae bacterium GWC2_58_44]
MFNPDPSAYLPHRPPFLFIDTILALEPGVAATGEFTVTAGGYFPPILLVEAMAQLGGIAAGAQEGEGGVLAAFERVVLPAEVRPKARFSVYSRIVRNFGRLIQVEGEVREDGKVIASAILTLGKSHFGKGRLPGFIG